MNKISVQEFTRKLDESNALYQMEQRRIKAELQYRTDLIFIHFYGKNWLETGKVGGWDEEADQIPYEWGGIIPLAELEEYRD